MAADVVQQPGGEGRGRLDRLIGQRDVVQVLKNQGIAGRQPQGQDAGKEEPQRFEPFAPPGGGRIGKAAALVGSALSVKPLLYLVDGNVTPLEKVRTTSRALARMEELAIERVGDGAADVAVQHLANSERAHALAGRIQERADGAVAVTVGEVGAVVGAHVGPGMIAVTVSPR